MSRTMGKVEIWLRKNYDNYTNSATPRADFINECVNSTGRQSSIVREILRRIEKEQPIKTSSKNPEVSSEVRNTIQNQEKEISRLRTALDKIGISNGGRNMELDVEDNSYSFGLIGDTHIGSLYDRMDDLENFYDICKDKGITKVLHAGDVLDGHRIYKGQEFEQYKPGLDAQMSRMVDNYPSNGIETIFVAGNHDQSFSKLMGINIGEAIVQKRPDFKFLGNDYGTVIFKTPGGRTFDVALHHPGGGSAYAISYRPQKIVESLSGGTKPSILGIGHYHKADLMPSYRNVCSISCGCFQAQTPFMVGKSISAHVGGWIIRFTVGTKYTKQNMIESQFIAYY
jgi:predicted phosphodiesterase